MGLRVGGPPIHIQLVCHDQWQPQDSRRQLGFLPEVSTIDAIATLVDDIGFNSNNKHFIDFYA